MISRLLLVVTVFVGSLALYAGCEGDLKPSETKSYRDVVDVRQCADGVRYWVLCLDGRSEYRSYADLQYDQVCLSRPDMRVTKSGGTFLGRISGSGPNCFMPYNTRVTLTQPPTMVNNLQAIVQPNPGALSGCNVFEGMVLRSDVEFLPPSSSPSYPTFPTIPSNPSYPCG